MPRRVNHDERRREIIEAVWQIIATRGLESVTMRSVAAAAGVSVGRIQHYFSSKEELVRHGCQDLIGLAAEVFEQSTGAAEPLEALRELVMHSVPQTQAHQIGLTVWYAYLAKSVGDPEIAAILLEAKRGEQEEGVRLLLAARQAGQVAHGLDVVVTVRNLLTTADGLALRVLIGQLDASEATAILEQNLAACF